jgi:hypothetical protein
LEVTGFFHSGEKGVAARHDDYLDEVCPLFRSTATSPSGGLR